MCGTVSILCFGCSDREQQRNDGQAERAAHGILQLYPYNRSSSLIIFDGYTIHLDEDMK